MAILAGFLLALSIAGPVAADAHLVTSSPEDEALVTTPPIHVTLTFDEDLDPAKSSFRLVRDGATIGTGKVSAASANVMTLDGLSLAPGGYEVRWTAGSTDGHLIRGTLTFTVSEPTPAPATPTPAATSSSAEPSTTAPGATATPVPTGIPDPASVGTGDVLLPIVATLALVAVIGVLVLRRARRA